jgi:hypothetical protein
MENKKKGNKMAYGRVLYLRILNKNMNEIRNSEPTNLVIIEEVY